MGLPTKYLLNTAIQLNNAVVDGQGKSAYYTLTTFAQKFRVENLRFWLNQAESYRYL